MLKRFVIPLTLIAGFIIILLIILPRYFIDIDYIKIQCRPPEPVIYIKAINRAQQAYFELKNEFADKLEDLQLGIPSQTKKYKYSVTKIANGVFNYGISIVGKGQNCESKCILGIPNFFNESYSGSNCRTQNLICFYEGQACNNFSYVGVVYVKKSDNSELINPAILCKSKDGEIPQPKMQKNEYVCGLNSEQID